jgi:hypothetical protein
MSFIDIPGSVFEGRMRPIMKRLLRQSHSGLVGLSEPPIIELINDIKVEYIENLIDEIYDLNDFQEDIPKIIDWLHIVSSKHPDDIYIDRFPLIKWLIDELKFITEPSKNVFYDRECLTPKIIWQYLGDIASGKLMSKLETLHEIETQNIVMTLNKCRMNYVLNSVPLNYIVYLLINRKEYVPGFEEDIKNIFRRDDNLLKILSKVDDTTFTRIFRTLLETISDNIELDGPDKYKDSIKLIQSKIRLIKDKVYRKDFTKLYEQIFK